MILLLLKNKLKIDQSNNIFNHLRRIWAI